MPTGELVIRHSTPEDAASLRTLRLEALENHPTAFGADYEENSLKPPSYWEDRLKFNGEEQALLFAEQNGQLIGMASIVRGSSRKSLHSANIYGVYIKPNWRGRQLSVELIRACLNWAKQNEIVVVKLAVVSNNLPAIGCYERCGFKLYGTEPKAICHDGIYYDEYLMSIEMKDYEAEQEI